MTENIIETWLTGKLFGIDFIFINFDTYYKSILELLVQKAEDFKTNFPNVLKAINDHVDEESIKPENIDLEDFKSTYYEYLLKGQDDTFVDITEKFPRYFRSFFLAQVYSYTESELKNICDYLYAKGKTRTSFFSFYNSIKKTNKKLGYVEGYLNYLSSYAGLKLSDVSSEMSDLRATGLIRNIIVHNSSVVKTSHGDWTLIKSMEEDFNHIQLIPRASKKEFEIVIPNDFLITKVIESSKSLFKKLLEEGFIKIK